MNDNDLITRREVELVLLGKGQKTKRCKWGETWELNFSEIREALSEYQPEIVRCKDCKNWVGNGADIDELPYWLPCKGEMRRPDYFCADGERRTDDA